MRRQLLFCLENHNGETDYVYVRETLNRFFVTTDVSVSFKPISLNGKGNYKSGKIQKKIEQYKKNFCGETVVIYFIDLDRYTTAPEDAAFVNTIQEYCKSYNYKFIFFEKDVEDVYLGHQVSKKEKVSEANRFRSNKMIDTIEKDMLSSKSFARHKSNILCVLSEYFETKE